MGCRHHYRNAPSSDLLAMRSLGDLSSEALAKEEAGSDLPPLALACGLGLSPPKMGGTIWLLSVAIRVTFCHKRRVPQGDTLWRFGRYPWASCFHSLLR